LIVFSLIFTLKKEAIMILYLKESPDTNWIPDLLWLTYVIKTLNGAKFIDLLFSPLDIKMHYLSIFTLKMETGEF